LEKQTVLHYCCMDGVWDDRESITEIGFGWFLLIVTGMGGNVSVVQLYLERPCQKLGFFVIATNNDELLTDTFDTGMAGRKMEFVAGRKNRLINYGAELLNWMYTVHVYPLV